MDSCFKCSIEKPGLFLVYPDNFVYSTDLRIEGLPYNVGYYSIVQCSSVSNIDRIMLTRLLNVPVPRIGQSVLSSVFLGIQNVPYNID